MEKSIPNEPERKVMYGQSVEGLFITGYEWTDYVESESEMISHFVSTGVISLPSNDFDEDDVIQDIISNHADKYLEYLEELKQIDEKIDVLCRV